MLESDFELPPEAEKEALLLAARSDFPQFYREATVEDTLMMDALVLAHVALVVGMSAPRDGLKGRLRDALERTTNGTEQTFTGLRERVRGCNTFQKLYAFERRQIEENLFEVRAVR